jgi:hypothetical protein
MKVIPISISDPQIILYLQHIFDHYKKILPDLTPLYIPLLEYMFTYFFLVNIKRIIATKISDALF